MLKTPHRHQGPSGPGNHHAGGIPGLVPPGSQSLVCFTVPVASSHREEQQEIAKGSTAEPAWDRRQSCTFCHMPVGCSPAHGQVGLWTTPAGRKDQAQVPGRHLLGVCNTESQFGSAEPFTTPVTSPSRFRQTPRDAATGSWPRGQEVF